MIIYITAKIKQIISNTRKIPTLIKNYGQISMTLRKKQILHNINTNIINYTLYIYYGLPVSVVHLIALLTFQRFQILLTPRMLLVWVFIAGIFARKAMLHVGWVISTLSCQYLYIK